MMARTLPALCLALLLGACATTTPYAVLVERYQAAPSCCAAMGEFDYQPIALGGTQSFDLDERSPAFAFDGGKSYFKAFALPEFSQPYDFTVRSYMLGEHIDQAYILFPALITLDENFQQVRALAPQAVRLSKAGFWEASKETMGLMYKLEGTLVFEAENAAERYLVVLTTDELRRAKSSLSVWRAVPVILPGIVGAVPLGKDEVTVPHAPLGRINVSLTARP